MMADPALIGQRWTLPTIEQASGGVVTLHVSIMVGSADELTGSAVDAQVSVGGNTLTQTSRPGPGELMCIEMATVTAIADFAFDNPGDPPVDSVTVTIQGQSSTFSMGPSA